MPYAAFASYLIEAGAASNRERENFVIPGLPYLVVYKIVDETVEILYVDHGAQQPRSQRLQ